MNQPPQTEKQTSKRIVSKGEYVLLQIGHRTVQGASFLLLAVAGLCFLTMVACGIHFVVTLAHGSLDYVPVACFFGLAALLVGKTAFIAKEKAANPPAVISLSQEEIDALPAPDTLVRASAEPVQAQEAVLLRAATEGVERHEAQLVRALAGGAE